MKKIHLLCTESTLKSPSLKRVADGLSAALGYKVWRTTKDSLKRLPIYYGMGVDKITQYKFFHECGLPTLSYTQDADVATKMWSEKVTVFGRKLLNSSCGKGIVVFDSESQPPSGCPVYTMYRKKKREFRVHVCINTVVAVVEKKRRKVFDGQRDTKIRNLANGYVFIQNVENEPEGLRELALRAAEVTHSDFVGVDIGYNEKDDELFVIEVNSAPGIQGSNVTAYVNTILEALK